MTHQVKKFINFSVSERLIILKLHVRLTCFCDLQNSISSCVLLSFLGDKFELDGGFLTLKIINFFSDFLLLHICNDLSWVKCVFCHIFLEENKNYSRSLLVKILSPQGCSYLRKLESLILCRCLYKGSTFCSALKDPRLSVDLAGVLNQRPVAQQTGAYPAELTGRQKMTSHES